MSDDQRVRLVQVNLAYDASLTTPDDLLKTYDTLTGWSEAAFGAGAVVLTIQRYTRNVSVSRRGVDYEFVADSGPGMMPPWATADGIVRAVAAAQPDVVHVNGLLFPGMAEALRQALPDRTAIVLQDHAGRLPRPWPFGGRTAPRWGRALAAADACLFTSRLLAERWHAIGLPLGVPIIEIPEAGSSVEPVDVREARRATRIAANPAILWVGRLDENKDPLTVLDGLERALPSLATAHCWMLYAGGPLEAAVRRRVGTSATLSDRVSLVGAVPHDEIATYFSAADIFISGSHQEGSGYALIEAMACGAMPCVSDNASFRALTGTCGVRWRVGDASACAEALLALADRDRETERHLILQRYGNALSWEAIGRQTLDEYRALVDRRRVVHQR